MTNLEADWALEAGHSRLPLLMTLAFLLAYFGPVFLPLRQGMLDVVGPSAASADDVEATVRIVYFNLKRLGLWNGKGTKRHKAAGKSFKGSAVAGVSELKDVESLVLIEEAWEGDDGDRVDGHMGTNSFNGGEFTDIYNALLADTTLCESIPIPGSTFFKGFQGKVKAFAPFHRPPMGGYFRFDRFDTGLFFVHFKSGNGKANVAQRENEARVLGRAIREFMELTGDKHWIILGDFNCRTKAEARKLRNIIAEEINRGVKKADRDADVQPVLHLTKDPTNKSGKPSEDDPGKRVGDKWYDAGVSSAAAARQIQKKDGFSIRVYRPKGVGGVRSDHEMVAVDVLTSGTLDSGEVWELEGK